MTRVYFIKPVGMDGPIKVGCSQSPANRRDALDNWSPFALEIIAEIDGDTRLERRFHHFFLASHDRREWFKPSALMTDTIAAINAGTFDINCLPEPRHLPNVNAPKRTVEQRQRQSISMRLTCKQSRTGFFFNVQQGHPSQLIDAGDWAPIEEFLAAPHLHGVAVNHPWARTKQAAWLAKVGA